MAELETLRVSYDKAREEVDVSRKRIIKLEDELKVKVEARKVSSDTELILQHENSELKNEIEVLTCSLDRVKNALSDTEKDLEVKDGIYHEIE